MRTDEPDEMYLSPRRGRPKADSRIFHVCGWMGREVESYSNSYRINLRMRQNEITVHLKSLKRVVNLQVRSKFLRPVET